MIKRSSRSFQFSSDDGWSSADDGCSSDDDDDNDSKAESLPRYRKSKLAEKKLPDHVLSDMTINKLRLSSLGLFGREKEQTQLKTAFERVAKTGSTEMVLIGGVSGSGKTLLASSALKPVVARSKGFFLTGKSEQTRRAEPFVAFASAFQELCQSLLLLGDDSSSSDSKLTEIGAKLCEELGEEIHVLLKLIPDLQTIVKVEPRDVLQVETANLKNQFHFAVRHFVRTIPRLLCSGPLVLLLDDIHWADSASLELLEMLVSDPDMTKILIVGTFRSNEMDRLYHDTIQRIESSNLAPLTRLEVNELAIFHINQLLAELLSEDSSQTLPLAEMVHNRTRGNALFVTQFIKSIHDAGLLTFSLGLFRWEWDVAQIERETQVSTNVADLITLQLQKLPPGATQVLRLIACAGAIFDVSLWALGVEFLGDRTLNTLPVSTQYLDVCKKEGILEAYSLDMHQYRFCHDKIREAVVALIPPDEKNQLEMAFGLFVIGKVGLDNLGARLFVVVDLLNKGLYHQESIDKLSRLGIAQANLLAAKKAIESGAFSQASQYCEKGIFVLPDDHWETAYAMALEIFSTASEVQFCLGDFASMHAYSEKVLVQQGGRPAIDKLRVQLVRIEALSANAENIKATALCRGMLKELGYKFPKSSPADQLNVVGALLKTKWMLRGKEASELLNLPLLMDESKIAVTQILNKLTNIFYLSKSDQLGLVILRLLQYSLVNGVSQYSADAFSAYGFLLTNFLGDPQGGVAYANLSRAMVEKHNFRAMGCRINMLAHALIMHWSQPSHLSLKPLLSSYEEGMVTGDMENGMWAIYTYAILAFTVGKPLVTVEADLRQYTQQMLDFKQMKIHRYALVILQFVLNLMGKSEHTYTLTGEVHNQEELLAFCEKTNDWHSKYNFASVCILAAYYFGEFELAMQLIRDTPDYVEINPGNVLHSRMVLINGLTCFAMARKTKKRKYLVQGKQLTAVVEKWVKGGCISSAHVLQILKAEGASLSGKQKQQAAAQEYNKAIVLAGRGGFVHDHALANELYGEFLLGNPKQDQKEAVRLLGCAHDLYVEWGAAGKAKQLCSKHTFLPHL